MNMKTITTCLVLSLALGASLLHADELKLTKDKDNVVSSRLAGNWTIEADLNQRLTGEAVVKGGENSMQRVTFHAHDSVFDRLPEKYEEFLVKEKSAVFMAGWMIFGEQKCPFFLVQQKGNPHILFFLKEGQDVFGNGESFNVMMAVAKDTKNDLLFIGGDFNNQPFNAYKRVMEIKK
jgi:hypothetical protein